MTDRSFSVIAASAATVFVVSVYVFLFPRLIRKIDEASEADRAKAAATLEQSAQAAQAERFELIFGVDPKNREIGKAAVDVYFDGQWHSSCLLFKMYAVGKDLVVDGKKVNETSENAREWRVRQTQLQNAESAAAKQDYVLPKKYLEFKAFQSDLLSEKVKLDSYLCVDRSIMPHR